MCIYTHFTYGWGLTYVKPIVSRRRPTGLRPATVAVEDTAATGAAGRRVAWPAGVVWLASTTRAKPATAATSETKTNCCGRGWDGTGHAPC